MTSRLWPCEEVLRHVIDVHCHPTDAAFISSDSMKRLHITICAMSTRQSDQPLVRDLAIAYPQHVVPCFGYHPWFTHLISLPPVQTKDEHYRQLFLQGSQPRNANYTDAFEKLLPLLPEPIPLCDILSDLRHNFETFPNAMLGEVGLDRAFRVPFDYSAVPRQLTPFTIPLDHQLAILEAQLNLAVEHGRSVSFHSVKAQMATADLLEHMARKHGDQWHKISIDMHSCGLSAQVWGDLEKRYGNIFLSVSTLINSRSSRYKALVAACSPDRILVESDTDDVDECTDRTWDMLRIVAQIKGWDLEDKWVGEIEKGKWGAVRKLEENWKSFKRGNHTPLRTYSKAAEQKDRDNSHDSDVAQGL